MRPTVDVAKRDQLLAKVGSVNRKNRDLLLVSLEEFFDGNDDAGSIWPNLEIEPIPAEVFKVLKGIRERKNVSDVLVLVAQFDGGEDEWPFSDTVFIITSASEEEVQSWFGDNYAPDEVWVDDFSRARAVPVPDSMRPIAAWWD
jgi:hypothetical protein